MVRHVTVCVNRVEYLFINVAVYSREGFSLPPHPYIYIGLYLYFPGKTFICIWYCLERVVCQKSRRERSARIFVWRLLRFDQGRFVFCSFLYRNISIDLLIFSLWGQRPAKSEILFWVWALECSDAVGMRAGTIAPAGKAQCVCERCEAGGSRPREPVDIFAMLIPPNKYAHTHIAWRVRTWECAHNKSQVVNLCFIVVL